MIKRLEQKGAPQWHSQALHVVLESKGRFAFNFAKPNVLRRAFSKVSGEWNMGIQEKEAYSWVQVRDMQVSITSPDRLYVILRGLTLSWGGCSFRLRVVILPVSFLSSVRLDSRSALRLEANGRASCLKWQSCTLHWSCYALQQVISFRNVCASVQLYRQ